ncbi:CAP domain-containing protein [Flavobacterium frigoris]|uniref:Allergen V5/Tpx-1 family protein n=1 Tax=Flavobacterium frigoris (strain PS1) TaxID=1086011 RepID=H7FSX6_FLAFP|nr:CAP domain-containing protein [Flavobacterium frigoris]EIA08828.1 allergen V5/Tpx-1 family protein [Flavobacterium frigoris PS1]
MKRYLLRAVLLSAVIFTMNSCSSDATEAASPVEAKSQAVVNYTYTANELEAMKLINDYRVSVGLNTLEKINHISYKSEEHDNYMITNNVVNHDDFVARSENIIKVLGAKTVGENIAYNYSSPQAALNAWLNSPAHKQNIEGNFTHFGIAIRENPTTGKKYYTNIFAKI